MPRPKRLRTIPTEHQEQAAFITWAKYNIGTYPELRWLHSVPNGARTTMGEAIKLKHEGINKGVPDLSLPVPRGGFHGLYIEVKALDGSPSNEQVEWLEYLNGVGYMAALAYGFDQIRDTVLDYLRLPRDDKRHNKPLLRIQGL